VPEQTPLFDRYGVSHSPDCPLCRLLCFVGDMTGGELGGGQNFALARAKLPHDRMEPLSRSRYLDGEYWHGVSRSGHSLLHF
jgi:hypothetical protein